MVGTNEPFAATGVTPPATTSVAAHILALFPLRPFDAGEGVSETPKGLFPSSSGIPCPSTSALQAAADAKGQTEKPHAPGGSGGFAWEGRCQV